MSDYYEIKALDHKGRWAADGIDLAYRTEADARAAIPEVAERFKMRPEAFRVFRARCADCSFWAVGVLLSATDVPVLLCADHLRRFACPRCDARIGSISVLSGDGRQEEMVEDFVCPPCDEELREGKPTGAAAVRAELLRRDQA